MASGFVADRKDKLYPRVLEQLDEETTLALGKLGKHKNTGWAFQKEWRYILTFMPIDITITDKALENAQGMMGKMISGTAALPFSHYDLRIRDDAFRMMEIMLSPKISDGNRLIVYDLVEKYNPEAKIVDSVFKNTLA